MTGVVNEAASPLDCKQAELLLGVLVLGVIDPVERPSVEDHVATCPRCRAMLADLAVLPGLLHRLDAAEAVAGLPSVSTQFTERVLAAGREAEVARQRRRLFVGAGLAVAAAITVIFAALFVPGLLRGPSSPAGIAAGTPSVVSATNPATEVQAKVDLAAQATGTQLTLTLTGVKPGEHCQLVAVDSAGNREVAATWVASYEGRATVTGTTSLAPQSITSLQVVRLDGSELVTMKVPHTDNP